MDRLTVAILGLVLLGVVAVGSFLFYQKQNARPIQQPVRRAPVEPVAVAEAPDPVESAKYQVVSAVIEADFASRKDEPKPTSSVDIDQIGVVTKKKEKKKTERGASREEMGDFFKMMKKHSPQDYTLSYDGKE